MATTSKGTVVRLWRGGPPLNSPFSPTPAGGMQQLSSDQRQIAAQPDRGPQTIRDSATRCLALTPSFAFRVVRRVRLRLLQ